MADFVRHIACRPMWFLVFLDRLVQALWVNICLDLRFLETFLDESCVAGGEQIEVFGTSNRTAGGAWNAGFDLEICFGAEVVEQ